MDNFFGLFNSPAFEGKTLLVRNGDIMLIDLEQVMKDADPASPSEVWNIIINLEGHECAPEVYRSPTWKPREMSRSYYRTTYGLPDDWEILTNHRKAKAACKSVKEMIKQAGLTQRAMAEKFGIPLRTVEDWCRGVHRCPLYVRLMIHECLKK